MNTMLRKLTHLLSPEPANRETANAGKEGESNLAEADSFLYGDGMGWTGIEIPDDNDEDGDDARLPPEAVQQ